MGFNSGFKGLMCLGLVLTHLPPSGAKVKKSDLYLYYPSWAFQASHKENIILFSSMNY